VLLLDAVEIPPAVLCLPTTIGRFPARSALVIDVRAKVTGLTASLQFSSALRRRIRHESLRGAPRRALSVGLPRNRGPSRSRPGKTGSVNGPRFTAPANVPLRVANTLEARRSILVPIGADPAALTRSYPQTKGFSTPCKLSCNSSEKATSTICGGPRISRRPAAPRPCRYRRTTSTSSGRPVECRGVAELAGLVGARQFSAGSESHVTRRPVGPRGPAAQFSQRARCRD